MTDATISLGGSSWSVPPLAVKQNKIVDPLIISLLPIFSKWKEDPGSISKIGHEQYENLITIAYTAITRAKPEFTRAQFDDLPVTLPELIAAFSIVAQQTGIFAKATSSGEATAG
jgi:hypothetical protein